MNLRYLDEAAVATYVERGGIQAPKGPAGSVIFANTNIVHGGSIIYSIECQVHYVMQCLALMLDRRSSTLEIPEVVNDEYNEEVQSISQTLAWGHPGVQSWYKNSDGKVVNNSPFSNLEFWDRTHDVEPNRYQLS